MIIGGFGSLVVVVRASSSDISSSTLTGSGAEFGDVLFVCPCVCPFVCGREVVSN